MNVDDTALLVIDVQERLAPAVGESARITWNCGRLLRGAAATGVAAAATEQYPEKLGPTVPELAGHLAAACGDQQTSPKRMFSCRECGDVLDAWQASGRHRVLLAGFETHVCVQQTALDLLAAGFRVYLAVDAVGSRSPVDHQTALQRMTAAGVTPTTTEAALFEWCVDSSAAAFKTISGLAKEPPPS
ncbi:Isochorismatase family protein [Posidoniimonas polymericola]|uniref:Isochorismatase family protein n=2 Tax=Posidoniimonas polymericola TaxID=2528002 RepID=A0A5C5YKV2_9BACT|nr:Isochorismatase family protein [Posidoniimonas polymericola]